MVEISPDYLRGVKWQTYGQSGMIAALAFAVWRGADASQSELLAALAFTAAGGVATARGLLLRRATHAAPPQPR